MSGTDDGRRVESGTVRVLVVDDEESMRHFLRRVLERHGYEVHVESDADSALAVLDAGPVDVLITDIRMPGKDGVELMTRAREVSPGTCTLLMTAFGSINNAIEAMRAGAENYLTKPFETPALLAAVERAAEKARLSAENRTLRELVRGKGSFAGLIGTSRAMRGLFRTIDRIARQDGTALITGESGTGKELVARAIHGRSTRQKGAFVAVHCGALPAKLVSSELFGVEQGAFTGADRSRPGYIERAEGGTLFLDEVGEIPLEVQPALLGFLEGGDVVRVGGSEPRRPDVRIVAATHRNLWDLVAEKRFREDLVYRLNVLPVNIPPLREHPDDIPVLVTRFLEEAGRPDLTLPPDVMAFLQGLPFSGNVRELRNLAERLASLVEGDLVDLSDLPEELREQAEEQEARGELKPYRAALEGFERRYLEGLLERTGGNVSEAARLGGLSRPSLHARIASLKLDVDRYRKRKSRR